MLLLLSAAAWAACPDGPTSSAALVDSLERATVAYAGMDADAFAAEHAAAEAALECLGEVVLPSDAAALHRSLALLRFSEGQEAATVRAFQASLRIQPEFRLPSAVAPAGGPVAELYALAGTQAAPRVEALDEPDEGTVYLDGVRTLDKLVGLPTVVQVLQTDGAVFWTDVVFREEELPDWFHHTPEPAPAPEPEPEPIAVPVAPEPEPLPDPPIRQRSSTPWWVGAAVTGAAAGGLYAASAVTRTGYDDTPTASGRQLTNALYLGSVGTGAVAIGLGTVALATAR